MMIALGNYFFHYRTTLSPILPLLLLLPGPILLLDAFAAALLGPIVALIGQIVRATTIGLEYIVRGGRNRWVFAEDLVTGGVFRHTRNPMYLGKFFMVLGCRHRVEPVAATARDHGCVRIHVSGDHAGRRGTICNKNSARRSRGSCRAVPRWWPVLSSLAATFGRTRFNWARVLAKEYSTPLGWTLPIVLIGLYNIDATTGLAERPEAVATLWGVLGAVTLFWFFAGYLKKARSPLLSNAD